jgi:hypothetical protein
VEFGSTLPRDLASCIRPRVIFESAASGIADETFGQHCLQAVSDDDFVEGWNHCFPA